MAEIAAGAGAHPNQITYYFGSKDALFVQAAFLMLLRDADRLEPVGRRQRSPETFRAALARTALVLPAVPIAVQAMSITGRRPELRPLAEHSLGSAVPPGRALSGGRARAARLGGRSARRTWRRGRSGALCSGHG